MKTHYEVSGNIVDVVGKRIFQGTVVVNNGIISAIREEKLA